MPSALLLIAALLLPAAAARDPASAAVPDAARQDLSAILAEVDTDHARRDEPGVEQRMIARLEEAEKSAPGDYEVLWRLARLHGWRSEDQSIPRHEKSRRGKRAWQYAERAIQADPSRVEGFFYAAAGMGNYSLGLGIMKALSEGIEGKFKDRLSRAEKIDPEFSQGAIPTAWGRFWFKLPWPKHDARKSRRALERALQLNPENVRARVYLGDLHDKEDRRREARAEWERAAAATPGRYDAPEERRWQEVARARLAALSKR
jgi:cytochrome c-type biogenesis protein CcmH/NrfG